MFRKNLKRLLLIAFITASFHAFAQDTSPLPWSRNEYLIDSFIDIALNNEYVPQQSGLRKWNKTIYYYYYIHRTADEVLHERLSNLHLQHLANITGMSIQQVDNKKSANLLIVFSTEKSLEQELLTEFHIQSKKQRQQLVRNSVCLAHFTTNKNSSIRKAIVIIPVDRARAKAKLVSCIVEELTQVMGLPNDSDKVFPSIFNDHSTDELLSGLDFILLKILYHPALKTGIKAKSIRPKLQAIIQEFKKQNLISNAQVLVTKGGLYPLLY